MNLDLSSHSLLLNPIVLVNFQILITLLVIAFTSPSSSIRFIALFPMVAASWLIVARCPDYLPLSGAQIVAGFGTTSSIRYIESVLLCKWSFDSHGPASFPYITKADYKTKKSDAIDRTSPKLGRAAWKRLRFALPVTFFPRRIGTPYETPHIPPFFSRDPQRLPSRAEFLSRTAVTILLSYLILDLCISPAPPENMALNFSPQAVPFLTRLRDITVRDVVIRSLSALTICIIMPCASNLAYCIMAFLAVGLGLTDVSGWRPLFGSPLDAYTIRRFWSHCWHQMFTPFASIPASFITYRMLRVRRNSVVAHGARLFLRFFIVGIFHLSLDVAAGIPMAESGALRFFLTQACGIAVESCVIGLASSLGYTGTNSPWAVRLLGYLWTAAFLVWSTPAYLYPVFRRSLDEKPVELPFSMVRLLSKHAL